MIFKKKNTEKENQTANAGTDAEMNADQAPEMNAEQENEAVQENAADASNAENAADEPIVEGLEEAVEQEEKADREAELQKALADEKDRSLRLFAELDNVRRRAARELVEERKYSGMEVIRAILPVMDNLQRAIEAASQQSENDALLEGVKMVYQQMTDALKQQNCTKIEALNQPFDPNFHQAISQMPNEEMEANTVMFVSQEGYVLHDRVVRPSQVVVSRKP